MTVKERISEYFRANGYSVSAFERAIGKGNGYWSTTKNPSADALTSIFENFPDLSAEYVFREEGNMMKNNDISEITNFYENMIKIKNERIDSLERELAKLRPICDQKKSLNVK